MTSILLNCTTLFGQSKPIIDGEAVKNWPEVYNKALISSTGKYVCYSIENGKSLTTIVQKVSDKKKRIINASEVCFFIEDDYLVFKKRDSLFVMSLPSYDVKYSALVVGPIEFNQRSKYAIKFKEKSGIEKNETFVLNPKTGGRKKVDAVAERYGKAFLKTDTKGITSIWIESKTGETLNIGNDKTLQIEKKLKISSLDNLFPSGVAKVTLVEIPTKVIIEEVQNQAKVTLWTFKDWPSQYRDEFKPSKEARGYAALIIPTEKRVVQLEDSLRQAVKIGKHTWLVRKRDNPLNRLAYGPKDRSMTKLDFMISEKDGRAISLDQMDSVSQKGDSFYATDNSQFIVYFNAEHGDYYSYNVIEKKTVNLTASTNSFQKASSDDFLLAAEPYRKFEPSSTFQILSDGFLVVNDGFDFWKLDPSGKTQPVCLTNHFGRENKINFQEIPDFSFSEKSSTSGYATVAALNSVTKRNGFFEISLDRASTPKSIVYQDASIIKDEFDGNFRRPIKAQNANIWLFRKSSASDSPNWFISDRHNVKQVSNIYPEKNITG
ncbi:hypothetical protein [Pedobacter sp. P26]|uniref:hypothetical protein n=1 Tax=Pedobacter sp. P26 TaxID=3423956 RepID=UPI003D6797A5